MTILKPLHGDEAGLFENLASFCEQDYSGAVQIVFGVENPNDPAIAVVERLRAAYPGKAIELVVEPRAMGSNPKIANLINMSGRIAHDIVVLADSDIRVRRDYLSRLVGALERFGGGGHLPLLRDFDRQPVVASRATDHRQSFSAGRRGRRAAEAVTAVPRLDHRAAPAIAVGDRRLRAARRLPGRRLCPRRAVAASAASRFRCCRSRSVMSAANRRLPNCGGTSCAGR